MAYLIKTYTFDQPISTGGTAYPFNGQTGISFADADEHVIYLDDFDSKFQQVTIYNGQSQKLLIETELGGTVLPEGTVMTYNIAKVGTLIDPVTNAAYYVFFPHRAGTSTSGMTEIGDRSTVMIVPMNSSTPPFDPTRTYNFRVPQRPSEMAMSQASIPPSYLNPVCFARGTLIETARGPCRVETLRAGDLVRTRDRGLRPLSWTGARHLSARILDLQPNLRPILIRADALGPGLPAQDLRVSPQHRVLVRSRIAERLTGAKEALVAARYLRDMPGVSVENPACGVDYHHLLFDRHEIVRSNGCWTELLHTGVQAMQSITPAARREIRAIFPELFGENPEARAGVRVFMTGRDARELTRRHLKHARPLVG